jgi:hypothetical protein
MPQPAASRVTRTRLALVALFVGLAVVGSCSCGATANDGGPNGSSAGSSATRVAVTGTTGTGNTGTTGPGGTAPGGDSTGTTGPGGSNGDGGNGGGNAGGSGGGGASGGGGGAKSSSTTGKSNALPAPTRAPGVTSEQLREAYRQSFDAECRRIWSIAPDGELSDPDDPSVAYTVNDCLSQLDVSQAELYNSIPEATQGGKDDAVLAAESLAAQLCAANGRCFIG